MTGARRSSRSPVAGEAAGTGLRQVSLARLAEFGIMPKRDLGQNFLIDDNILDLILLQLQCGPEDVVLEVGAGLGVLTAALARVAGHVHAYEVDRSLEPALRATLAETAGGGAAVSVHLEDVLRAQLESLAPPPTLCASNLPYSVAGPLVIESLQRLPSIRRYCLMVQREVAERMAAGPGGKVYGVLSVWVQLYSRVVRVRPLSRAIFYPQPHVDSSLIVLERRAPAELPGLDPGALRSVVQAAFGQRRKTLVNALAAGLELRRERAVEVVVSLGLAPDVRAERLAPAQFVQLAERLAAEGLDSSPHGIG